MADRIKSEDQRVELKAPTATPLLVSHETEARLTRGLGELVSIDGAPAAVEGSAGPNEGEHKTPKSADALVPHPTDCRVVRGNPLLTIDGKPVAVENSLCIVPDVLQPAKSNVLVVEQDLMFVEGQPVARGSS